MAEANLTPRCVRGARAILGWDQAELAKRSNVSRATIAKFENEVGVPSANNLEGIRRALELVGFSFVTSPENNCSQMTLPETWKWADAR